MTQAVNIREYNAHDCRSVQSLLRQLGYAVNDETLQQSVSEIYTAKGRLFVAEIDNTVVARAQALIETRLAEGRQGELVSLVVDNNFRGQKIGQSLSQHVEPH